MTDQVNFAIVGCGRISDLHAKAYLKNPKANLAAICDLDEQKADEKGHDWGVPADMVFQDVDAMLKEESIDVVDLLLPHHLHAKMTEKAAKAGKHVSVQKPMALNLTECQQMIDVCADADVKLRVFENFRFYPPYVKAKELLEEGAIGPPSFIHIKLCSSLSGGWNVPLDAWEWRFDDERCGGGPLVWDDGYHKFSIANYFLGEVEKVKAWIDCTGVFDDEQEPPTVLDAPAAIMWKYKKPRCYGSMDVTYSRKGNFDSDYYAADERVEITGEKGYIWINQCTAHSVKDEPPLMTFVKGEVQSYPDIETDWQKSFDIAVDHFVNAILEGKTPSLTGEEGMYVQRFAHAAHFSAQKRREINLEDVEC